MRGGDWIAGGTFAVAGDRIEAATMVMAAAATGGSVHLDNITTGDFPDGLTHTLAAAGNRVGVGGAVVQDGLLKEHDVAVAALVEEPGAGDARHPWSSPAASG
ncbi:hypothetical protein JHN54_05325 [Streptomyces sp. MBT70]|nr:hypothetical protein [Streptomyces sp. MBT70]GGR59897.1 hypothetical protein GCM10010236_10810 [Streptomyces eurythermus]